MHLKKLRLHFNVVNIVKLAYFKITDCRRSIIHCISKLYIFITYKFIEYPAGSKLCSVTIHLSKEN